MSTITEIRDRLEAKAGDVAGTRPYWDCIDSLLDVAEAAQEMIDSYVPGNVPHWTDLEAALKKLPQDHPE